MSLIAIGDIHGCRKTFKALWEKLPVDEAESIVFVGDYIDRGSDSRGVVSDVIELAERYPCVFLRGNHEAMMLEYLQGEGYYTWSRNGGVQTLHSYSNGKEELDIPESHRAFLQETIIYHETNDYFFVHGGIKPNLSVAENKEQYDEDVFLWERSHLKKDPSAWEKTVVCGHTPVSEPILLPRLIAIDTGCVFHNRPGLGRLSAVILPEREVVSVDFVG